MIGKRKEALTISAPQRSTDEYGSIEAASPGRTDAIGTTKPIYTSSDTSMTEKNCFQKTRTVPLTLQTFGKHLHEVFPSTSDHTELTDSRRWRFMIDVAFDAKIDMAKNVVFGVEAPSRKMERIIWGYNILGVATLGYNRLAIGSLPGGILRV